MDLPDQSGDARVHSYNFLCSISFYRAINYIFSSAKITQTLSIFIKRLEKTTVHCGFTQITWLSILHVLTGSYLCFYVHLADLSSVRYKTSEWNEIKELTKSNYFVIPSLLNKSPKNITWNDRWETKLFLGGQGTACWNGSEINNLTSNPVQSSWRYLTFHPTLNRKLFFIFFLLLAFILQFAQYFHITFTFLAN